MLAKAYFNLSNPRSHNVLASWRVHPGCSSHGGGNDDGGQRQRPTTQPSENVTTCSAKRLKTTRLAPSQAASDPAISCSLQLPAAVVSASLLSPASATWGATTGSNGSNAPCRVAGAQRCRFERLFKTARWLGYVAAAGGGESSRRWRQHMRGRHLR